MKYILVLASIVLSLVLVGCASQSFPIEPSVYLLSTDKEPRSFLNEIAEELGKSRYEVESLDLNVGLLKMEPRRFVVIRGDQRTYAQQTVQVRQEGGSVKVRMSYLCEYGQGTSECNSDDDFATDKINRIERIIMAMLNRKLFKKPGAERTKAREI